MALQLPLEHGGPKSAGEASLRTQVTSRGTRVFTGLMPLTAGRTRNEVSQGNGLHLLPFKLVGLVGGASWNDTKQQRKRQRIF